MHTDEFRIAYEEPTPETIAEAVERLFASTDAPDELDVAEDAEAFFSMMAEASRATIERLRIERNTRITRRVNYLLGYDHEEPAA